MPLKKRSWQCARETENPHRAGTAECRRRARELPLKPSPNVRKEKADLRAIARRLDIDVKAATADPSFTESMYRRVARRSGKPGNTTEALSA